MGKGMRAGRDSKAEKKKKAIVRALQRDEEAERKRLVRAAGAELKEDFERTLSYHHNVAMIAEMFALRDEFCFGKKRLLRVIAKTAEHKKRMLKDQVDIDEMLEILKKETGIRKEEIEGDDEIEIPVRILGR